MHVFSYEFFHFIPMVLFYLIAENVAIFGCVDFRFLTYTIKEKLKGELNYE
jgi:hypothetical protein